MQGWMDGWMGLLHKKEAQADRQTYLDDAAEGPDEVRVLHHFPLVVPHGLDELRQPDAHVDRQRLPWRAW